MTGHKNFVKMMTTHSKYINLMRKICLINNSEKDSSFFLNIKIRKCGIITNETTIHPRPNDIDKFSLYQEF